MPAEGRKVKPSTIRAPLALTLITVTLCWLLLLYSATLNQESTSSLEEEAINGIKTVGKKLRGPSLFGMLGDELSAKRVAPPPLFSLPQEHSSSFSSSSLLSPQDLFSRFFQSSSPLHPPHVLEHSSPSLEEIKTNLTRYLSLLHGKLGALAGPQANAVDIWETFLSVTSSTLIVWEEQNLHRFSLPRSDGSIFVSIGTFRDEFCPMTLKSLYQQAKYPENVFVGLLQQNCFEEVCYTGVLENLEMEETTTDVDCYQEFCQSKEGIDSQACVNNQVRLFNVNESESLGPYMARYFGAKLYQGEEYYLQIDSHSEFVQNWDEKLMEMIALAPAKKPVISTYPPAPSGRWQNSVGNKICDSEFATPSIEYQIVRLSPSMPMWQRPKEPVYAPFVAAGFMFSRATMLHEVPFDPLLPWIFMGEEISMSARLWTSGYDLFSPTTNVLNHYYVRRHKPKFWETVNRYFQKGVHNDIVEVVIRRVKNMLGYPECSSRVVQPSSVLYKLHRWSMGRSRSFSDYMQMVGLDAKTKVATRNNWCHNEEWPEIALKYKTP